MAAPSARATGGGKALPTWRYAAVLRPEKDQPSGNPCRRETISLFHLRVAAVRDGEAPGESVAVPTGGYWPASSSADRGNRADCGPGPPAQASAPPPPCRGAALTP